MGYHQPKDIDAALALIGGGPVKFLAGGTDLYPATEAPALSGEIVDLAGLSELKGISRGKDGIRFGAATTWSQIARADLPPALDALKAAAREVGSVQIQNAGTLGGNLCNASPAADGVPPLLIVNAEVEIAGRAGRRRIPLDEFILGNRKTALEDGEIFVAIHIPDATLAGQSVFEKLGARHYLVISIAMVAVRLVIDDGRIAHAAVSVGACSAVAQRLEEIEKALHGSPLNNIAPTIDRNTVAVALSPIDDVRADADYRIDAAVTLLRRAVTKAIAEASVTP